MADDTQLEIDSTPPVTRFRTIFHPGATGPLPRDPASGKAATVGVPPITYRGRSYSRAVIGASTGIHVTTISKYFTGSRTPSVRSALKLAAFFNVSVEELLRNILPRKEIIAEE